MMAPDSDKAMPVFGSWMAAHNGYQQLAAGNKHGMTGKAKGLILRTTGCLPTYQEGVRSH